MTYLCIAVERHIDLAVVFGDLVQKDAAVKLVHDPHVITHDVPHVLHDGIGLVGEGGRREGKGGGGRGRGG